VKIVYGGCIRERCLQEGVGEIRRGKRGQAEEETPGLQGRR